MMKTGETIIRIVCVVLPDGVGGTVYCLSLYSTREGGT